MLAARPEAYAPRGRRRSLRSPRPPRRRHGHKRAPEIVDRRSGRDRLLQQGSRVSVVRLGRYLVVEVVVRIVLRQITRLVEGRVQPSRSASTQELRCRQCGVMAGGTIDLDEIPPRSGTSAATGAKAPTFAPAFKKLPDDGVVHRRIVCLTPCQDRVLDRRLGHSPNSPALPDEPPVPSTGLRTSR